MSRAACLLPGLGVTQLSTSGTQTLCKRHLSELRGQRVKPLGTLRSLAGLWEEHGVKDCGLSVTTGEAS